MFLIFRGARHGHKLSGKLARLEQQEKVYHDTLINEETKKHRKSKKNIDDSITHVSDSEATNTHKKKRKRKRSKSQENEIEEEAYRKRYEEFCDYKERKKFAVKYRAERKEVSKISEMLESFTLDHPKSDDDGFDEKIKKKKKKVKLTYEENLIEEEPRRRKKNKKKRKRCKSNENFDDPGFCELIKEISGKLESSREIRKKLRAEKRKSDEQKICKISEELDKMCNV